MSHGQTHISFAAFSFGLISLSAQFLSAAPAPVKLSGVIGGVVTNPLGAPQMGATVLLYNHQDRVCDKVLTDEKGEFRFLGLFPDLYSVRVSLAAFIPAVRKDILVQPGMLARLTVNLNNLFSSIQIAYPRTESSTLMTDDWKWVLRGASSTRPVLRFLGDLQGKDPAASSHSPVFSDTRGLVQLSAGDGTQASGTSSQADMGTAFALATSLFGNNQLQLSGNLGYGAQTGVPVAAFRTAYSRGGEGEPEFSVTMRQLFLPGHSASGTDAVLPVLRSVSASMDDRTELSDDLAIQYGFTMDSVSFGDRLTYFSPYARLSYSLSPQEELSFAYTTGNARPDLAPGASENSDLQRDINSIGLFPRLSLLNSHPKIQRGTEFEMAYSRNIGSRTVELSAYREVVNNTALSVAGLSNLEGSGDFLPDLFTGNAILNAGDYTSTGFTAGVTQKLGENVSATVMYGTTPGLSVQDEPIETGSPDELRSRIRASRREGITARIAMNAPKTGTHLIASYQWLADSNWVTLGNIYSTQSLRPMPGLNLYIRQPLPRIPVLPWRVEATVDLRNLLAEGYLPLDAANGQRLLLFQTPRSFRGGFSFVF